MNNIHVCSTRNRNVDSKMFSPVNFSIANYSTDAESKTMKNVLGDTLLLNNFNNLHLIPDPLKKNLADSVISGTMEQRKEPDKLEKPPPRAESFPTLGGITNFFSGVFNVMSAIFQKRSPSPTSQYYDCFDDLDDGQMSPSLAWRSAKFEVQNKNEQISESNDNSETMSVVTNCEDKLNQVRLLLNGGTIQKIKPRRPRRFFVEPGSVEDSFEDAFCPENLVKLANDTLIECYGAYNHQENDLFEVEAPIVKTEVYNETMDIVKNFPENANENEASLNKEDSIEGVKNSKLDSTEEKLETAEDKHQVVLSCEDKINKIKALLQCKKQKDTTSKDNLSTSPIPIKEVISSSFANEVGSSESDMKESFDEVAGRFYSSSADSDDSFQIVFSDRKRIPSDCESEDSFIVFEESPDSCYVSNDVFGSDSDSEMEDDSGYVMTCLNHSLSRTIGDLTDDSLYSSDVVDCAGRIGEAVDTRIDNIVNSVDTEESEISGVESKNGLLLDDKRKKEKQKKPAKKVRFSEDPPKVHVMRVWAFAARQARAGHWERHALDRERFRRRIADVEMAISWVLKPQHRSRVMFQRFMPWWNALKRQELAEKKALEEKQKEIEKLEKENSETSVINNDLPQNETNNDGSSSDNDDRNIKNQNDSNNSTSLSQNEESSANNVKNETESSTDTLNNNIDLDKETTTNEKEQKHIVNGDTDDKLIKNAEKGKFKIKNRKQGKALTNGIKNTSENKSCVNGIELNLAKVNGILENDSNNRHIVKVTDNSSTLNT